MSFNLEHYFRGCDLVERLWRCAVNRNPKTKAVNEKLDVWHRQNPDKPVSVAAWRIANARRRRTGRAA
jgi:hypothetical protein